MTIERVQAEAFPVADFIEEEMKARGWTVADLALRMGWKDQHEYGIDHLTIEFTLAVRDPRVIMSFELAAKLGRAFDVNPELFLNLDRAYREYANREPHP